MLVVYLIIFFFGLSVGSFLNAWVWRTHQGLPVGKARSMCTACRKQIRWFDNIPLFSYLFLRGRCRDCGEKISWQYPFVELWMGIMFVVAYQVYMPFGTWSAVSGFSAMTVRDWYVIVILSFIFLYDLKHQLILDRISLPAIVVLFVYHLFFPLDGRMDLLIALLLGGGFFLIQFLVSKGKWIGGGDIRLGALMGVILGSWPLLFVALGIAYVLGAIVSLGLIAMKKATLASETPFGTYLVVGTLVSMYYGREIVEWYVSFL